MYICHVEKDKIFIAKFKFKKPRSKQQGGCIISCPEMDKFYMIKYFKSHVTWESITISRLKEIKNELDVQSKTGTIEKLKCDGPYSGFCNIADFISSPL